MTTEGHVKMVKRNAKPGGQVFGVPRMLMNVERGCFFLKKKFTYRDTIPVPILFSEEGKEVQHKHTMGKKLYDYMETIKMIMLQLSKRIYFDYNQSQ